MSPRRSTLLLALLAVAACSSEKVTVSAVPPGPSFAKSAVPGLSDDTYLVRFRGNIPSDFAARVEALGGTVIFTHAGAGVGAVRGLSADAANTLALETGVEVAIDDAVRVDPKVGELEPATTDGAPEADAPSSPSRPDRAVLFGRQWNMRAIQANLAWAAGKLGSATTKVGILDTGLDYLSADLYGRVDLVNSRSYLGAAEDKRVTDTFGATTHPIADLHFHGTHVGATIVSNAIFFAGVTSRPTLVGFKVCAPGTAAKKFEDSSCPTSAILNAIVDAVDMGIPVINMSLGGYFLRRAASARGGDSPSFIAIINSVFQYAYHNGTTIVVAAGNDGVNMQHIGNYYASYCDAPHVICVSATGPAAMPNFTTITNVDAIAPYSNTGNKVVVAAPGGTGNNSQTDPNVGWVYAVCSGFSIVIPVCQGRFFDPVTGRASTFLLGADGTSMASPHAAGVAALIAASVGNNPDAIRTVLTGTADDRGAVGKDVVYGFGRVNAFRATQ